MLAGVQKPMLGMKLNRAHPLAKGLRGCWLFNEGVGNKAYDLSGYSNHGTLSNMAFPPTIASGWNPGKAGVGLIFNGSTNYVNCGNDPSLNITNAITIAAWVKPLILDSRKTIAGKQDNRIGSEYWKLTLESDDTFAFSVGGLVPNVIKGGTVLAGIWTHVVGVYDGSNLKIYVNGDGTTTSISGTANSGNGYDFRIGTVYYNAYIEHFNGSIGEVMFHNRALSAEEVKSLYSVPYAMFERGELLL